VLRFDLPPDYYTGKRRQATCVGKTKAACLADRRRTLEEDAHSRAQFGSRQTVRAWLEYWLTAVIDPRAAAPGGKLGTPKTYRTYFQQHVYPHLGDVFLGRLSPQRCQEWVGTLVREGCAPRSIHNYAGVLGAALAHAVATDVLAKHPMRGVQLPTMPVVDRPVWDQAQLARFLALAVRDAYHPFWWLAAFTGMRVGELIALRWADIDLETGRVQVRRAFRAANERYTSPKRTASIRVLYLDDATMALLANHKEQQAAWIAEMLDLHGRRLPRGADDEDLVCLSTACTRLAQAACLGRMRALCVEAGVPYITVHGIRRTHSTRLLDAGEDVGQVARRLGHANVDVTRRHYWTISERSQQELATRLRNDLLGPVADKEIG
jgi:integrase